MPYRKLDLNLPVRQIKLAFSLSKMTILNEMNESEKLEQILFVEFLEFIARIAQIVFKRNETMKLYDKIYDILMKMFDLIPAQVNDPLIEDDYEYESDNEEY